MGVNISDSHIPNRGPLVAEGRPGDRAEEELVDFDVRELKFQLVQSRFPEATEGVQVPEGGGLEDEVGGRADAVATGRRQGLQKPQVVADQFHGRGLKIGTNEIRFK